MRPSPKRKDSVVSSLTSATQPGRRPLGELGFRADSLPGLPSDDRGHDGPASTSALPELGLDRRHRLGREQARTQPAAGGLISAASHRCVIVLLSRFEYSVGGNGSMQRFLVTAADRRGAQWILLVPAEHPPLPSQVEEAIKTRGRAVEVSGQLLQAAGLDFTTLRVLGPDRAGAFRGGGPRHTIDGYKVL